jgi:translin
MPEDLGVVYATYLNGLAESVGELRRRCLDILRHGYSEEAERLLGCMDEVYGLMVTLDYPDAVTNGLRRHTDLMRGIVERTRADLTISLREQKLQELLTKVLGLHPELPTLEPGESDADHPSF